MTTTFDAGNARRKLVDDNHQCRGAAFGLVRIVETGQCEKLSRDRTRDAAAQHSLDAERERFHAILKDVDRLWGETGVEVERAASR